jgi:hypothetical protein
LKEIPTAIAPRLRMLAPIKFSAAIFVILLISVSGTCSYMTDVMDVIKSTGRSYWFLDYRVGTDHTIGLIGIYYTILNFCLLTATVSFAACFLSTFYIAFEVGEALGQVDNLTHLEFDVIKIKLSAFTVAYVHAKILVVLYIINLYIWQISPLAIAKKNVWVTEVALVVIGVFFVSLPRYFVELQWYLYKWRVLKERQRESEPQDLRSFKEKMIAYVCDTMLIGGFTVGVCIDLGRQIFK